MAELSLSEARTYYEQKIATLDERQKKLNKEYREAMLKCATPIS